MPGGERGDEVLAFLDAHRDELVAFAGELIATPSPNPPGDERRVAAVIIDRLEGFGVGAEVVAASPERPNVLVRLSAGAGPRLLLSGHTDTKPPGDLDEWKTDPYVPTVVDGRLHGLGACDMKAQIAALVYAAVALAAVSALPRGELLLALSADEECGSRYGAAYLVGECDLRADAAVVAEASSIHGDWDTLALLARGFSGFRIKVHGTQIHSSLTRLVPTVNASTKMASVLARIADELEIDCPPHPLCPDGLTVNPGVFVRGGVYYGVCPGYAEFGVDVRTLPGMSKESLRANVEAFLARLREEDPSLTVEMEFEEGALGWNEATEINADAPVVEAALAGAEEVLGRRPSLSAFPGGTDAVSFQGTAGIPTIPAFGPGALALAHRPNESISTRSIGEAAKIYALLALRYLAGT